MGSNLWGARDVLFGRRALLRLKQHTSFSLSFLSFPLMQVSRALQTLRQLSNEHHSPVIKSNSHVSLFTLRPPGSFTLSSYLWWGSFSSKQRLQYYINQPYNYLYGKFRKQASSGKSVFDIFLFRLFYNLKKSLLVENAVWHCCPSLQILSLIGNLEPVLPCFGHFMQIHVIIIIDSWI